MSLALLGLGMLSAPAHAEDSPDNALSVLMGTSLFDDPSSLRLSVRGEVGTGRNALLGASVLLPLTLTTERISGEGLELSRSLLEIPVSLRGRILPGGPVRLYGDIGVGAAIGTSQLGGWLVEGTDTSVVAMTRTAVGLEIGNPRGFMVAIEPASWSTYFTSERIRARYGLMVGLNLTL